MKEKLILLSVFVATVFMLMTSIEAAPQRKTRVDFDELMVRGQTKKADAVYVFERGELRQKDLTKPRENYRKEILETMFE